MPRPAIDAQPRVTRRARAQVGMVEQEFRDLRELLLVAGSCKKPEQAQFEKLLGPLQKDIEAITHAKETNRKDREWFNHLSTVAEGAPCVGWVTVVGIFAFQRTNTL